MHGRALGSGLTTCGARRDGHRRAQCSLPASCPSLPDLRPGPPTDWPPVQPRRPDRDRLQPAQHRGRPGAAEELRADLARRLPAVPLAAPPTRHAGHARSSPARWRPPEPAAGLGQRGRRLQRGRRRGPCRRATTGPSARAGRRQRQRPPRGRRATAAGRRDRGRRRASDRPAPADRAAPSPTACAAVRALLHRVGLTPVVAGDPDSDAPRCRELGWTSARADAERSRSVPERPQLPSTPLFAIAWSSTD